MKFNFYKNKTPKVEFVTTVPGLEMLEDCLPKPAKEYIPQWWKNSLTIKTKKTWEGAIGGNMKVCPSFSDYFTKGYIIPMWCDSHLYYNSETKDWSWATADNRFIWSSHPGEQYLDYVDHKFLNQKSFFVFKIQIPWYVFTSKNYSLYQLPTFFHFNEDFSVVPGVRDTDIYHEMNIQLVIHSDKKEIFIPRGTPLAQYIPFKREKTEYNIREATKKDLSKISIHNLNFSTRFVKLTSYLNDRKKQ